MAKAIGALAVAVQAGEPIILWSDPGIGKTETITALAAFLKRHLEVQIGSISEPTDLGIPVVQDDGNLRRATPAWVQRLNVFCEANDGGVLLLDELTGATPSMQNGYLRLIHERMAGDTAISPKVSIVAAANPVESACGGNELGAPMANRLCHQDWPFDHQGWIDWLVNNGTATFNIPVLPPTWREGIYAQRILVAGFNKAKTTAGHVMPKTDAERSKAWPSPRSWDMLARLRAAGLAANAGRDTIIRLSTGSIGNGMGAEFEAWIDAQDLPDAATLVANPKSFVVPDRGDKTYTILLSVAAYVAQNMSKGNYLSAWQIFNAAAKGHCDIAASAVVTVVRAAIGKPFMSDKEVRDALREYMKPFQTILKNAGILTVAP